MTEVTPTEMQKTRWKYAAIIAGIGALLVAGGFLAPASWLALVTGVFGF